MQSTVASSCQLISVSWWQLWCLHLAKLNLYFVFFCQLLSSVDSHCFVNLSSVLNNFPHLPFDVNCCQMSSQLLSTYLSQLKATGVHFPATTRPLPCFWQKARHSIGERHISFVYQDSSAIVRCLFGMDTFNKGTLLYNLINLYNLIKSHYLCHLVLKNMLVFSLSPRYNI